MNDDDADTEEDRPDLVAVDRAALGVALSLPVLGSVFVVKVFCFAMLLSFAFAAFVSWVSE